MKTNKFEELNNVKNINELKAVYRKLAMLYHPDKGGNVADMQDLNNLYELLFEKLKRTEKTENNKHFNEDEKASDYIDIIQRVINLKINDITIEEIGSWLWISGNTYPIKEALKEIGFQWSKSRKQWYYTSDIIEGNKYYKKDTMDNLRAKYGSRYIKGNSPQNELT